MRRRGLSSGLRPRGIRPASIPKDWIKLKKQVLVSVDRAETRVALLEANGTPGASRSASTRSRKRANGAPEAGYRIAELYLERRGGRSIVGNIYKGKVDNVLPGLEAAFVDIGLEKNGFLHVDEIVLPGVEAPKRGRGSGSGRKIADLLGPGQEIVVQVVKDPLKTKGARLSMELTIAGRYMVYAPTGEGIGVSRRLEDRERERLRKQTAGLDLGGGGVIVRTAAHGAKRADFERELKYLHKLHEVLGKRVEETVAPDLVFQEADLSVRVVRDIFSAHFERAIVDDEQQFNRLVSFFTRTAPELVERVELWEQQEPLFEAYGVDKAIEGVLSRRVDLPSGGYLMIDYAEALTVIDVNSGSLHRPRQGRGAGGHDHEDQPGGRRGGRQPAAPARHRRDHRDRLHRHGARAQPRRGDEDAQKDAGRGPHEDVHGRDLKARPGRDDAPERDRGRARDHEPPVPDAATGRA